MYGQKRMQIDSLQKVIVNQSGIEKIHTLNELAWELRRKKDSTAIHYALEALALSKEFAYTKGISDAITRLGDISRSQKLFSDAKNYYLEVLKIDQKNGYTSGIARANNQLGLIHKKESNHVQALAYFLESLDAYEKIKNYKNALIVSRNIGELYASFEDYGNALKYFLKEVAYAEEVNNKKNIAIAYTNLGALQKKQRNYNEAFAYFENAKKIYQNQQLHKEEIDVRIRIGAVLDYLNQDTKAIQTYDTVWKLINTYKVGDRSAFHHNLATFYKKKDKFDSALYHFQKSKHLFEKENNQYGLATSYNNLGNLYYELNDFQKALYYLRKSLTLQKKDKKVALSEKTYASIAKVYNTINKPEQAYAYKDSAYTISKETASKIKTSDRNEVSYLNEKRIVAAFKNKQDLAEASVRQKNTIIVSLLTALILSTVLFFYVYKSRKQKQQRILAEERLQKQELIALQERNVQEQKMQQILKSQEMNAINAMINGQEEERKRIAQDLHDKLGSMLSVVKIHYQSVEENMERIQADSKLQYVKANQLLDDACKAVREIAHNMVSGTLARFGLKPALEELKQTLEEASELKINLVIHKLENRLDTKKEMQIYRIIQELLNNIIKHAQATEVTIQLLKNKKGINIVVEDDGTGFDIFQTQDGLGLRTVASRVAEMKGAHFIDSSEGNGTIVTIDVPL